MVKDTSLARQCPNQLQMNKARNELLNWYLAFLRKNAQLRVETKRLTPMGLVKADHELLKQQIEEEALKQISPQEGKKQDQAIVQIKPAVSGKSSAKFFAFVSLVLSVGMIILAFLNNAALLILLSVLLLISSSLCLMFISKEHAGDGVSDDTRGKLEALLAESEMVPDSAASNVKAEASDKAINQTLMRSVAAIELMLQKEHLIFDFCPYLLCKLTAAGQITEVNETSQILLGYSRGELVGLEISEMLFPPGKTQLMQSLERCKTLGSPEDIQLRIKEKSGRILDFHWRSEWSSTANAYFCMAEEITAQKENERMKDEMTTMINHDLRAPISGLGFWIDNMLAGNYGELGEDTRSSLKYAERNISSILSLLDNLLAVEKLESNKMTICKNKVRLQDCFTRLHELYKDWCLESELKFEIENTQLIVEADPTHLIRILGNLLSNAIKWSAAGTAVKLRAHSDSQFAVIEIEDRGPGISADLVDSLFERWNSSLLPKKDSASSGLGLYIAKKLSELQGGAIGMKRSPTGASIFWITIPLAKEQAA